MQWVAVDLGNDAAADRMAWVLEACNAAIAKGSCRADGPEHEDGPDAVAIVRVRDTEGRRVRIEVGRRREARSSWAVRELEFERGDPLAERWRSVGLALATLVGEIEDAPEESPAASAAESAEPEPAESAIAGAEATNDGRDAERDDTNEAGGAAAGEDSEGDEGREPETSGDDAADRAEPNEPDDGTPPPRPRAMVGLGVLAGSGSQAVDARFGAGGQLAWIFDSGLEVSLSADHAVLSLDPGIDLTWWRLHGGAGYRHWLDPRWSVGAALRVGARRLEASPQSELQLAGGEQSASAWSPHFALSGGVWWQVADFGGLWLELELGSIGRETRLLGRRPEPEARVPPIDTTATFGLWWAP